MPRGKVGHIVDHVADGKPAIILLAVLGELFQRHAPLVGRHYFAFPIAEAKQKQPPLCGGDLGTGTPFLVAVAGKSPAKQEKEARRENEGGIFRFGSRQRKKEKNPKKKK